MTSTSPDPPLATTAPVATTSFAEPPIVVSGAISTKSQTVTNSQIATFTHANGVEPVERLHRHHQLGRRDLVAGTITLSGTTYRVTGGPHTYTRGGKHTITTTVTETGTAVDKVGEQDSQGKPWKRQDVVRLPKNGNNDRKSASSPRAPIGAPAATGTITPPGRQEATVKPKAAPGALATDQILALEAAGLVPKLLKLKHAHSAGDRLAGSLLSDFGG